MEAPAVSPETVRSALERLVASKPFAATGRLQGFLRYIVEETLAGRAAQIKEYTIGLEVYGRGTAFNPKTDAIVRVEAGRLRARLQRYYEQEGSLEPVRIELPKGSYVPVFRTDSDQAAPVPPKLRNNRLPIFAAALTLGAIALWALRQSPSPASPLFSIAVLPLAPLGTEPENGLLADALTEQLTLALSKVDGFRVASRTSASRFKGKSVDSAAVGRELGVDAFLEGGAKRSGGSVSLTVQLITTRGGFHLWSQKYESNREPGAHFEETVCNIIARTLGARFAGNPSRWSGSPGSGDPVAVDLYVKGHEAWLAMRRSSLLESVDYFQKAIARDPRYAQAYSGLAQSGLLLAEIADPEPGRIAPAKAAARQAIALDERDADAHAILGNIYLWHDWDFAAAERELHRAIILNPGSSAYERWYGIAASALGRYPRALDELPIGEIANPTSEAIKTELGQLNYELGQWDNAWKYAQQSLALAPQYQPTHLLLGLLHEQKRNFPGAFAEFGACVPPTLREGAPRNAPFEVQCQAALAHAYAISGAEAEARKVAGTLRDRYIRSSASLALVHLALGDRAQSLRLIEQAFADREPDFLLLKTDPRYAPLRAEPRCRELLRSIGL